MTINHYFPVFVEEENEIQTIEEEFNITILSQSCDLIHDKIENIVVCPIYTLTIQNWEIAPKLKKKKNN